MTGHVTVKNIAQNPKKTRRRETSYLLASFLLCIVVVVLRSISHNLQGHSIFSLFTLARLSDSNNEGLFDEHQSFVAAYWRRPVLSVAASNQ